jgi:hypothetical protein
MDGLLHELYEMRDMGVTAGDLACSSACLRVLHGFELPSQFQRSQNSEVRIQNKI